MTTTTWTHCGFASQNPPGQASHSAPSRAGHAGTRTVVDRPAGLPQPIVVPPPGPTIVRSTATPARTTSPVFANRSAAGCFSPDLDTCKTRSDSSATPSNLMRRLTGVAANDSAHFTMREPPPSVGESLTVTFGVGRPERAGEADGAVHEVAAQTRMSMTGTRSRLIRHWLLTLRCCRSFALVSAATLALGTCTYARSTLRTLSRFDDTNADDRCNDSP
jgi:hypothetical protein